MTDKSNWNLAPCPFCGSAGKMISCMGNWQPGGYEPDGCRITCSNDSCSGVGTPFYGEGMEASAIAWWNRRASPSPPPSAGVDAVAVKALLNFDVREYVDEYEFRGDAGDYQPTERERVLLEDAIAGVVGSIHDAIRSALTPAPTPFEAGGEAKGWAAVYDGQIKSCHRDRETCVADAEHYQAIHPVYLGPAWRHQED